MQRGRPPKYDDGVKQQARIDFLAGDSPGEIALKIGCSDRTVRQWIKRAGWDDELKTRRTSASNLEAQINRLSAVKNPTNGQVQRIAMLTRSLERLRKTAPKPKPIPIVRQSRHADLLREVLKPEFGLYSYQRDFLMNEARFRLILKSRQIGFSFILALDALLACAAGRDQLIYSASQEQSDILIAYAIQHATKLGLGLDQESKSKLTLGPNFIRALPANPRTVQGFAGDIFYDEFAWQLKQKAMWRAGYPSITAVGGRATISSTPFTMGSLFWEIATNHKQKWSLWDRTKITIHDAVKQGMVIPGGIDELRANLDGESWALMYECQWMDDNTALLSWELLEAAGRTELGIKNDEANLRYIGVDVGRINDKTAIAHVIQTGERNSKPVYHLQRMETHKGLSFDAQRGLLNQLHGDHFIKRMQIDRTGLGMQLAEEISNAHPSCTNGVWFSAQRKEELALNVLKLLEEERLTLPLDPGLYAQLHAVKRIPTASGIKYDAARDEQGHADDFWALALAVDGLARGEGSGWRVRVW